MAGSPQYKVYDSHGTYQAACKEIEAAAALMGFYGPGATIKSGHNWIVWREGSESQPAAESYDHVAQTVITRRHTYNVAAYKRNTGREYPG